VAEREGRGYVGMKTVKLGIMMMKMMFLMTTMMMPLLLNMRKSHQGPGDLDKVGWEDWRMKHGNARELQK
jgi:hypothetical protein